MKLFSILLLLISSIASAAVPSGAPLIALGSTPAAPLGQALIDIGCPSSTTAPCFSLYFGIQSAGANATYHLFKNGVTYQVTTGKTAYCFAITMSSASAGSAGFWQLFSATNNYGQGDTSSWTGAKWQGGASGAYISSVNPTANAPMAFPGMYFFDALSYPGIQTASAGVDFHITMTCYEK